MGGPCGSTEACGGKLIAPHLSAATYCFPWVVPVGPRMPAGANGLQHLCPLQLIAIHEWSLWVHRFLREQTACNACNRCNLLQSVGGPSGSMNACGRTRVATHLLLQLTTFNLQLVTCSSVAMTPLARQASVTTSSYPWVVPVSLRVPVAANGLQRT